MQPKFSIKCDSTDPSIPSCTATWEHSSGVVTQRFNSVSEAMAMENLINSVYISGYDCGVNRLIDHVKRTLEVARNLIRVQ